jgi:peptidoglycan LD-endopeptidase CwlK
MPTELVSRIDLDLIYPPFLQDVLETLAACKARDAHYVLTFGYRSFDEQKALYAKGRTAPGPKVTNAPAGMSCHNYGIAVDAVRDFDAQKSGLQPDWSTKAYDILKQEGERRGLQVGVPGLSDPGHVQLPLSRVLRRKESLVLSDIRKAANEDIKKAWSWLDQRRFSVR